MTDLETNDLKNGFKSLLLAEEEKDKATAYLTSIYADMKSKGYDIVALKKVVADYKKGVWKAVELEQTIELYRENLGLMDK